MTPEEIYWDRDHFGIALGDISFCNHSDDPNCAIWRNTREKTCTVMAIRDIKEGEEITFDYQFTAEPWFEVA